jgi:hypothetical protein
LRQVILDERVQYAVDLARMSQEITDSRSGEPVEGMLAAGILFARGKPAARPPPAAWTPDQTG